ncbi:EspF repeat-containing protein [Aestuariivita sp.]|uniref:EspF repeat-containing protein n=1 Tax=Aestuariivita sp. TaxID=1872407 RepID=UPI003BB114AA
MTPSPPWPGSKLPVLSERSRPFPERSARRSTQRLQRLQSHRSHRPYSVRHG